MESDKELLYRFIRKIKINNPEVDQNQCWEWQGCFSGSQISYPYFRYNGSTKRAHKFSYKYFKGEVPDGITVNHDCNNKKCVNPKHLSLMTIQENLKLRLPRKIEDRTQCKKGHPLTGDNLYLYRGRTKQCYICKKEYMRHYSKTYYQQKKEMECVPST